MLVFSVVEETNTVTPEERQLLSDLAGKIAQTPPPPRDAEAEDFIRKNIGSRPDALYLMTQNRAHSEHGHPTGAAADS